MLKSNRILITQFQTSDWPFIIELLNSPAWLQFIGDRNVHSEEQAIGYLVNGPMKSYHDFGFGLMKVQLLDSKEPIGICGLLRREPLLHPDLGFAFLPQYMGRGYAFETARMIIQHAKAVLGIPEIDAIVQPDNERSISLLRKLQFQFVREFCFPEKKEVLSLYTLSA